MEGLINLFAERLFRPLALGLLMVLLAPELAGLAARQSQQAIGEVKESAPTGTATHQAHRQEAAPSEQSQAGADSEGRASPSDPTWIGGALLLLFLLGHWVSAVGQIMFQVVYSVVEWFVRGICNKIKAGSFFALVKRSSEDGNGIVRQRYDYIRFQVDLLCGIAGVGLTLMVLPTPLGDVSTRPGAAIAGAALFAAIFQAIQFKYQLSDLE